MSCEGKVAFVTGAGRGIGRAIALELAACGARVALNDMREDDVRAVAVEIEAMGGEAIACVADVSDRTGMERAFTASDANFGRLDMLVANAAFSVRKPLLEMTAAEAAKTFAVCLDGVFHAGQLAAQRMAAQGGGAMVLISSVHAFRPYGPASTYNAAKAAINQMGASWALELAEKRIRVNVIEPGWIDTPGERQYHSEEKLQAEAAKLPLGRLGRPEEIAKAAAFLLSGEAGYITGSVLRVDGGISLQR